MSEPGKAVFLSYASQDAAAAQCICEALRAAGVEVWFDQNELVGGDAWDAKIRKQIAECALFVPLISAATQARREGYFRLEWRIAAQRTHMMSESVAFLLPVVIDATRDAEADVPGEFKAVQWTRLPLRQTQGGPGGEGAEKFCARVNALLGGEAPVARVSRPVRAEITGRATRATLEPRRRVPATAWIAAASMLVIAAAGAWLWLRRPASGPGAETRRDASSTTTAATPLTETQKLVAKARALLDDDPLMTRANVALAEQLALEAVAKDQTDAEAYAAAAWANFRFLSERYDDTPQRRASLHNFAEKARLLAPDSVNAELAVCGDLFATGNRTEAQSRLQALAARVPGNFTVLRERVWAAVWGGNDPWGPAGGQDPESLTKLRAFSPVGRAYADSIKASRHWVRGEYAEADRLMGGVFAAGQPARTSYLVRLLVVLYGWGDVAAARDFVATIPAKLLLEDVFIAHVANVWVYSGEHDKALATLDRTQREFLQEALIFSPVASLRGSVLAAAGRPAAAAIQWREALRLVEQRLAANPGSAPLLQEKARVLVRLGDRAGAAAAFALANEIVHPAPGSIAWADDYDYFALIGDLDAAVARIDRLIARDHGRWPNTYNALRHEPALAALRQDPRAQPLLARGAKWLAEMKAGGAPGAALAATGPKLDEKSAPADKSVAVLAFDNRSDDKDAEYFSDGISEELINALGRVPGLTVRGPTSAFFFKGRNATASEIAEKLGVNYLVRGSVRKAGGTVRITAQLSRAATDEVVWTSEPLERELKNVFAVQDEIVALIAKNLSVRMGVAAGTRQAVDPEALTALLQGRKLWVLRTTEGFARARELFNRAATLDPSWAPAHAALANLLTIEASFLKGAGSPVGELFATAAGEAKRAIELDATLGEPHAALGKIAMEDRRYAEAEVSFRRALALEPNNAMVHDWQADLMVTVGRLDLAIPGYRRALELDPLAPYIHWDLAWELLHVRRYAEALTLVERAAELTPAGSPRLTLRRARLLLELGRRAEAEASLGPYLTAGKSESDPQFASEAAWCLHALGPHPDRERWAADLLRQHPDSFSGGVILLMRGDTDQALRLLETTPTIFQQQLYWDPVFDSVRDTPRFRQLLEKLGCVEQYTVARETQARLLKEGGSRR
ncbi:MAG: TIR domain-containing protein [Verrucomicrobia bacterium]|nr:TIR domain-containing protein [Verrucomicrobiota bacterium]